MVPALLCFHMLFNAAFYHQAKDWRGIRPLQSTRADVERLVGRPLRPGGATYDTNTERVTAVYADGRCVEGWPYGWDVPAGTVVSITARQKMRVLLRDLPVDLEGYEKAPEPVRGVFVYSNEKEGVSLEVGAGSEVLAITYSPSASDSHRLCPEALGREREIKKGESAYQRPMVYYGDIPPAAEKAQLDYFAGQLRQYGNNSRVYIIGYAGRRSHLGEARVCLDEVRNYLTNKHGVESRRIVIIDGGHRDDVRIELYVVPDGNPKPLPTPNIHPSEVQVIERARAKSDRLPTPQRHNK